MDALGRLLFTLDAIETAGHEVWEEAKCTEADSFAHTDWLPLILPAHGNFRAVFVLPQKKTSTSSLLTDLL